MIIDIQALTEGPTPEFSEPPEGMDGRFRRRRRRRRARRRLARRRSRKRHARQSAVSVQSGVRRAQPGRNFMPATKPKTQWDREQDWAAELDRNEAKERMKSLSGVAKIRFQRAFEKHFQKQIRNVKAGRNYVRFSSGNMNGYAMAALPDGGFDDLPEELSGRPAWVVPAAVGGGVLVLAGGALVMRKRKKNKKG